MNFWVCVLQNPDGRHYLAFGRFVVATGIALGD